MQGVIVRSSLLHHDAAAAALRFQRLSRYSARDSIHESRSRAFNQHHQPHRQFHNLTSTRDTVINRHNHDRANRRPNYDRVRSQANSSQRVRHASTTSRPPTASTPSKPSQTGTPVTPKRVIPIKQRTVGQSPRSPPSTPTPSPIVIANPDTISGTTEVPIITLANSKFRLPEPLYPAIDLSTDYRALWYRHTPDPSLYAKVRAYWRGVMAEVERSHNQSLAGPHWIRRILVNYLYQSQLAQNKTTPSPLLLRLTSADDPTGPAKKSADSPWVYKWLAIAVASYVFVGHDFVMSLKSQWEESRARRAAAAASVGSVGSVDAESDGTTGSQDSMLDKRLGSATLGLGRDGVFDASVPPSVCAMDADRTMKVEQLSDLLNSEAEPTGKVEQLSDLLSPPSQR